MTMLKVCDGGGGGGGDALGNVDGRVQMIVKDQWLMWIGCEINRDGRRDDIKIKREDAY